MLVRDLVCNNNFDCNCNYRIYGCTKETSWHESNIIFENYINKWEDVLNKILDLEIKYVTLDDNAIIIEASLKESIDFFDFSVRLTNILNKYEINTVEKLCSKTFDDMRKLQGMGRKSLSELVKTMKIFGLCLRESKNDDYWKSWLSL